MNFSYAEKKNKSLKYVFIINFFVTISIGVMSFLVNKYFGNYMGAENLGLMRLFSQLIAYLSLAEMGLGTASAYSLYKPLAEKNYNEISIIISTISDLYKKISMLIFAAGIILIPIIPMLIKETTVSAKVYIYWSLYVLNTCITYSYAKYIILFTANQQFGHVRKIQGLTKILSQTLQIYVLIKYQSFLGFILLLITDNLLQYILFILFYRREYTYIKKVKERDKSIKKNLVNLFWHKLAGIIVFNTDYIVIAKFISLTAVGIYSSYLLVLNIIGTFLGIVSNVITPRIGSYIAVKSKEEIFELWKKINILYIFAGTILTYVTYKMINSFIYLWMGKEYLLTDETVFLIMVNLFIQSVRGATDIFKMSSGYFSDIHLPISEGMINLVFSIILVNYIGLNGVVIGTIISNVLIIYIAQPVLVFKNCFGQKGIEYIKIMAKQYLLILASVLILNNLLGAADIYENIINWNIWMKEGIKIFLTSTIIISFVFILNKNFRDIIKIMWSNCKKH